MSKRLFLSAVSVLLIAFGSVNTLYAQGATGEVDGQVVDSSGNGIAEVEVTLSHESSGLARTVTTNTGGNFKLQLPPGMYACPVKRYLTPATLPAVQSRTTVWPPMTMRPAGTIAAASAISELNTPPRLPDQEFLSGLRHTQRAIDGQGQSPFSL
jgi:hypothetical protein